MVWMLRYNLFSLLCFQMEDVYIGLVFWWKFFGSKFIKEELVKYFLIIRFYVCLWE